MKTIPQEPRNVIPISGTVGFCGRLAPEGPVQTLLQALALWTEEHTSRRGGDRPGSWFLPGGKDFLGLGKRTADLLPDLR